MLIELSKEKILKLCIPVVTRLFMNLYNTHTHTQTSKIANIFNVIQHHNRVIKFRDQSFASAYYLQTTINAVISFATRNNKRYPLFFHTENKDKTVFIFYVLCKLA